MVRSGLQQDVINMYRRGVKLAFSRPPESRSAFLLHLRYNFHHPPLKSRDYTAIEHQLRKMDRTLEMLETGSVQRLHVTPAMQEWWEAEVRRSRLPRGPTTSARSTTPGSPTSGSATSRGDSHRDTQQWGGTLPGHGGT
ncbi:hypothetical protein DB88DRAFT_496232 [Papiliotrema laurentii]|uniref:Succinate dehydrogenase assembly factor 1, mitochondrial n=1 Tax=Papiliotrema laurentii TaxID=5418 RepID=A0AAD9D104_PAPLA|nr:hypothetical protein DB88DRAFT_496232 [Papiliotrema laurentii]